MIVVDTNVLAYLYLEGEFTPAAEELLIREPVWAAPVLWRSEFRNVLAGSMRRGLLSLEEAAALQQEAESLLEGAEYEPDSRLVLELVDASACSAYDCEFVALAVRLDTRVVTMDRQLLRAFPSRCMPLPAAGAAP